MAPGAHDRPPARTSSINTTPGSLGWWAVAREFARERKFGMSTVVPPMQLVMFGRPGCGKSSLAERLGADFGFQLVRTGELLREAVRRGDFLGSRVASHLARGDLVPDELIFELLEINLKSPKDAHLLFDGFPRTLGQVALLEQFEKKLGFEIDCFLDVVVSREDAIARMTGRRVCPTCGATYHVIAKPPKVAETCDIDGTHLERRKDDTMDVVAFRQKLYEEQTQPIIDHYLAVSPQLCRAVNGVQSVDAVYAETCRILGLVKP
jgi:adenylate kinase